MRRAEVAGAELRSSIRLPAPRAAGRRFVAVPPVCVSVSVCVRVYSRDFCSLRWSVACPWSLPLFSYVNLIFNVSLTLRYGGDGSRWGVVQRSRLRGRVAVDTVDDDPATPPSEKSHNHPTRIKLEAGQFRRSVAATIMHTNGKRRRGPPPAPLSTLRDGRKHPQH